MSEEIGLHRRWLRQMAGAALALPVALFVLGVAVLQGRHTQLGARASLAYIAFLGLLAVSLRSGFAVLGVGLSACALVTLAQLWACPGPETA